MCAPYKNVDGLVRAFRELRGDVTLLIAGRFHDPSYEKEILTLARGDPRIRICPGYVPDDKVHTYLTACDAVVVPYREILTSGTAMLALSCGRPVVSVFLGFLRDLVTPEVGLLFAPDEPDGLRRALSETCGKHYDEEKILQHARRFTYEDAAKRFVTALMNAA